MRLKIDNYSRVTMISRTGECVQVIRQVVSCVNWSQDLVTVVESGPLLCVLIIEVSAYCCLMCS